MHRKSGAFFLAFFFLYSNKDLVAFTFSHSQSDSDKSFCVFRKKMSLVKVTSKTFLRVALATVVLTRGSLVQVQKGEPQNEDGVQTDSVFVLLLRVSLL